VNIQSSHLPFWMLNHEEVVRILCRAGSPQEQEVQAVILKDAIREARQSFADQETTGWITVDTPVPYAVHELRRILRERMGLVNKSDSSRPYLQLESRLASLIEDKRFSFLFDDDLGVDDNLAEIVGRLLRIPVKGKPVTIVDLSGLPSEIADVIVSVISRVLFDFTLWSDPEDRLPVLLVCEEAHRYLPASGDATFAACTRAISRIAREGRKYGLSLALISQRPSELAPQALSQCATIFALRMGNDHDQHFVESVLPDTGQMMLATLPNLPAGEAVVFGEAVSLPMHVRFDELEPKRRPRSHSAQFSLAWQTDSHGESFLAESIRRWRMRTD
jgi:DNA helicase HerA-like ATPase